MRHNPAHCAALSLLLAMVACASEGSSLEQTASPVTREELDGRAFLLETSKGFEPLEGTSVELSFSSDWLNIYANCNHQGGHYEIAGSTLLLTDFGMNQIACRPEQQVQDAWLASLISARARIARNGDRLILSGKGATLVFLDREIADRDQPLAGVEWSVDALLVDERPSPIPRPKDPILTFRPDGVLDVDTSCNVGQGNYTISGHRITLSNVTYSERPCASPYSFNDEHVRTVMADGDVTFAIDARRLTIERDNLGLGATRLTIE